MRGRPTRYESEIDQIERQPKEQKKIWRKNESFNLCTVCTASVSLITKTHCSFRPGCPNWLSSSGIRVRLRHYLAVQAAVQSSSNCNYVCVCARNDDFSNRQQLSERIVCVRVHRRTSEPNKLSMRRTSRGHHTPARFQNNKVI